MTYFVVLRRTGPQWDPARPIEEQSDWPAHASFMDGLVDVGVVVLGGPLADERRVVLVVVAESEDDVRAVLARDPWSETHLVVDTIDLWTIRLDARRASQTRGAAQLSREMSCAAAEITWEHAESGIVAKGREPPTKAEGGEACYE